jgi:hypothetical protein
MKIAIDLTVIHAALHDDFPGELTRLLSTVPAKIARQLERSGRCICEALESDDKLLDINGNTVGHIRMFPTESREDHLLGLLKKIHDKSILVPDEEGYRNLVVDDALDIWNALYDEFGDKEVTSG